MCLAAGITPPPVIERMKGLVEKRKSHARQAMPTGAARTADRPEPLRPGPKPVQDFGFTLLQSQLVVEIETLRLSFLAATEKRTEPLLIAYRTEVAKLCHDLKAKAAGSTTEEGLGLVRKDFERLRGEVDSLAGFPRLLTTEAAIQRSIRENDPRAAEINALMQALGVSTFERIETPRTLRRILSEFGDVRRLRSGREQLRTNVSELEKMEREHVTRLELLRKTLAETNTYVGTWLADATKNGEHLLSLADRIVEGIIEWLLRWNEPSEPENRKKVMQSISQYLDLVEEHRVELRKSALQMGLLDTVIHSRNRQSSVQHAGYAAQDPVRVSTEPRRSLIEILVRSGPLTDPWEGPTLAERLVGKPKNRPDSQTQP